ncbi:hypothetical protein C2E23DRAFT_813924 [Lenzites betulinus]|nr:hypothetical protein C2E23DRAFT_813924 [Lenzites betulinus]
MTSLRRYAAERRKASLFDPTISTGTPITEPIPMSARPGLPFEVRECSAPLDEQIHEPRGLVGEIAREYARIREEAGPRAEPEPVLDDNALRMRRDQERAAQKKREDSIICVQYRKLLERDEYIKRTLKEMDENGYFNRKDKEEMMDVEHSSGGGQTAHDNGDDSQQTTSFVQGTSCEAKMEA